MSRVKQYKKPLATDIITFLHWNSSCQERPICYRYAYRSTQRDGEKSEV